jgi:Ran GTPase-activating protein (RanGAP) involved in mRNA processing and transport
MVVNIMSKEQEQNENIKSFTDYVDKISSGENKEEVTTIFDLAIAYNYINFDINETQKKDLQKSLIDKYKLENQNSLSEIIDIITEQAIDKAIANKYKITFQDIDNAISQLPENLAIKIINSINNDIEENENVNLVLNDRCTTEILKSLVKKGLSVPEDSIVKLMNQKMDDVVYGKIKYLLSLNIEYSKDFAKDLIDDIAEEIFKDQENIIANYAKYEDVLLKIKDKLKIDLLDDFKTQISKIEEVQNFAQDVLKQKIKEFNGYNKEEEKDAHYLNIILDLHHLDVITNSNENNPLTRQFISGIKDYDVTKYNNLVEGIKKNKTITRLELWGNEIGDDGAKALAAMLEKNKTITTLDLSGNNIVDDVIIELGRACAGKKNITVVFGNNGYYNLFKLAQGTFTGTTLNLSYNRIGDDRAKAIASILKMNKTITKLDLSYDHIRDAAAIAIAEALKVNNTITELDLSRNNIGKDGAIALADALINNTTITELNLEDNKIGKDGAIAIAEALKVNNTITKLDLSWNNIGDDGAKAIAKALINNTTITELNLAWNNIIDAGVIAIAEALEKNETITKLNLWGNNNIGDDGVIALGRACAGKEIEVYFCFNEDYNYNLFKKARKYVNKEVESSYFFNIPAFTTGMLGLSTFITLATIITLSILGSQGIIGFDSAAFIAPIASVGVVNLVTFIGFAITEFVSKVMDYNNIDIYNKVHGSANKVHGLAKKQTLLQVLNPCHKVQFVDKELSKKTNNEETPLIRK